MSIMFDRQPVFAERWKRTRGRWPQEHAPPCIGSPGWGTWWWSLEPIWWFWWKRNLVVDPAKVSATITTRRSHHTQHLGNICEESFDDLSKYLADNHHAVVDNNDDDDDDDDGGGGANYNHAEHLEDMLPPCALGRELVQRWVLLELRSPGSLCTMCTRAGGTLCRGWWW